jgi:hypothetical protein
MPTKAIIRGLITMGFLFMATKGWSAIAFGSANSHATAPTGNSATASLTISGGATQSIVLIAGECPAGTSLSTVTYAGIGMIKSTGTIVGASANGFLYYQLTPPTGTNNGIFTCTGAQGAAMAVSYYTGVSQFTPIEISSASHAGGVTTSSVTVTTITNNDWIVSGLLESGAATWSATSPLVKRSGAASGTGGAFIGDVGPISPAGITTTNWTAASTGEGQVVSAMVPSTATITSYVGDGIN